MKVITTAIGLLIYGELSEENLKLDVFHVKYKDIQAMELSAHEEGGELTLWLVDQDTTIQYNIFDDDTYERLQNQLIKLWEKPEKW